MWFKLRGMDKEEKFENVGFEEIEELLDELLIDEVKEEEEKKPKRVRKASRKKSVKVTERDEEIMRMVVTAGAVDMETLRRFMEVVSESAQSERLAYRWAKRMKDVGLVDAETVFYGSGQILWATRKAGGAGKPRLLSQTMRHDLMCARVSAKYLAQGYAWSADEVRAGAHKVDGVAVRENERIGVEVELTQKSKKRLDEIMRAQYQRGLGEQDLTAIHYYCTPGAGKAVREAVSRVGEKIDPRFVDFVEVFEAFDSNGREVTA